jgi:nitrite reductase/ring-hydroxylating ferredoxin subunit
MKTNESSCQSRVVLFSAELLKPGQRQLVDVDGVEIAVVNVEGNLYAFRNTCPHQGASMIFGPITGTMLPSEPQKYQYGCDNEIVRCPLHGWEFEMKSGKSIFAPDKVSIKTFEVREEEGFIVLLMNRNAEKVELRNFACS